MGKEDQSCGDACPRANMKLIEDIMKELNIVPGINDPIPEDVIKEFRKRLKEAGITPCLLCAGIRDRIMRVDKPE